jgi:hypothetical protein
MADVLDKVGKSAKKLVNKKKGETVKKSKNTDTQGSNEKKTGTF